MGNIFSGRQVLTVADLNSWQADTELFMSNKPGLAAALKDPSRIFKMDEKSVQVDKTLFKMIHQINLSPHFILRGFFSVNILAWLF